MFREKIEVFFLFRKKTSIVVASLLLVRSVTTYALYLLSYRKPNKHEISFVKD